MPDERPAVGMENGQLVCPMCWSLCLTRTVEKLRATVWVWWCGCGWTSSEHESPKGAGTLVQRFTNWRKLNRWSD